MRLRPVLAHAGATASAAVAGAFLTTPRSAWYLSLRKPPWQPPASAFGPVWTSLYALTTVAGATAWQRMSAAQRSAWVRALGVNLALNATWNGTFFRAHRLTLATVHAGVLALSTADLARRASHASGPAAVALVPYAVWSAFATVLSGVIARRNPHR